MGQREGYYGKLTDTEVKKFREEENARKIALNRLEKLNVEHPFENSCIFVHC